ncbi:MAG TPA: GNAT family N-acetyltransferase [Rubricoccaceae bacterium]|nr:GNAT family N-acetyltransferase [Rubricoccaceae bacterium]
MEARVAVRHAPEARRFEADGDGGLAVLEYLGPRDGRVVFTHTGVPEEDEGEGIGSALAKAALDWAQAEGLRVLPLCPFVAAYLRRHPAYQPLVEERR